MSVNSNVAALAVQRSLLNNTRELATSMQRLNTGVRINSAADDAAGVSIADRMESQIKSYGMAVRNAGDAISMLETAEGGLGSIADTLATYASAGYHGRERHDGHHRSASAY